MHILLKMFYEGTSYAGWQRQKNAIAVQNVLEDALEKVYGFWVESVGSGRTDSGVHAGEQYVKYTIDNHKIDILKLPFVINNQLPQDIRIIQAKEISDSSFHPRYSARVRQYRYILLDKKDDEQSVDLIYNRFSWFPGIKINEDILNEYLQPLVGVHDFTTFSSVDDSSTVKVREIFKIEITRDEERVYIDIFGNAFLKAMIRSIIGNLIFACKNGETKDYLKKILEKKDPLAAPHRSPACGLILLRVYYNKLFGERDYYKRNEN